MNILIKKILDMWRIMAFGMVLALLVGFLLFWRIGEQPTGLSNQEVQTIQASQSLHQIYNEPLNMPLTFPEHFLLKWGSDSATTSRTVSAIYATLAIVLFFLVLRFWQDNNTALLGTALFGTSSWLLHVARLDTVNVLSLGVVLALAMALWFKHTFKRNIALLLSALVCGILLYIPGLVWFLLLGAVWIHKDLIHELKHTKIVTKVLGIVLFLLTITPLIIALVKGSVNFLHVLGLPSHFANIATIGHNFLQVPLWLFWRGPASDPSRWLGTTPVLNVFEIVMLLLGIYSFWRHRQLGRSKAVLGGMIVGWILVALGGPVSLSIMLPFLYIAIAGGVLYMFESWFSVFPANPFARTTGIVFVIVACIISCNYHLQNYFVAWQHSPSTKAVFDRKPPAF